MFRAEDLLQHTSALRALARRLVRDADTAEGLVQSTWVRALEHRPRLGRGLGAWLGTVLRNEARQQHRSARRRGRRERSVARDERVPSAAEVNERLAVQREVLEAVESLQPAFREVVWLRWFEELPPREIAARLGLPRSTVKTRLERANVELRTKLDARHGGDRSAWMPALAAFAWPGVGATAAAGSAVGSSALRDPGPASIESTVPAASTTTTLAALIMTAQKSSFALPIALAALVAAGLYLTLGDDAPGSADPDATALHADAPAVDRSTTGATLRSADATTGRTEIAAHSTAAETPAATGTAPPAQPLGPLTGLVLAADGLPANGVTVRFDPDRRARGLFPKDGPGSNDAEGPKTLHAATDARGVFSIPRHEFGGHAVDGAIAIDMPGWTTLAEGQVAMRATQAGPTIVTRAAPITIHVHRSGGAEPIAGARAQLDLPEGFRARFPFELDRSADRQWRGAADAAGNVTWPDVPTTIQGCVLEVSADGYEPWTGTLDAGSDRMTVALRSAGRTTTLRGIVRDAELQPVGGARVAFGSTVVRSADDGSYEVIAEGATPDELFVVAASWQPVRTPRTSQPGGQWPEWLEVQLADAPVSIRGQVLRADGKPHDRAEVWVADPTWYGIEGQLALSAESEMHKHSTLWRAFATDSEGRFEIPGLLAREYEVRAVDRDTAQIESVTGVVAGGEPTEIRFSTGGLIEKVTGRVVDGAGQPVAGMHVTVKRESFRHTADYTGAMTWICHADGARAITDEDGQFELTHVPASDVFLGLDAEGVFTPHHLFEGELTATVCQVLVARACPVRIEADQSYSHANRARFLDSAGEELLVVRPTPGTRFWERVTSLTGGRSELLEVPDTTRTVILLEGDQEVARLRVQPNANELVVVRG